MSKGWRRLWTSLAISWFGTWAAIAAYSEWQNGIYLRMSQTTPVTSPQYIYALEGLQWASKLLGYAVWGGVVAPLLAAPFIALAYWSYRGFKQP